MAKLAVQHFNNGNVKSYTFLKLSKVNSRVVPHLGERGLDRALYYMTFEATEDMVGSPQNFQALVLSSEVDGKEVRFCRIETSNPPDLDLEDIPPLVMLTML
ncbi:hypothetical protein RHGRI_015683 [Rhododendron griersonianum]|uniref:Uncharacterized protein n=1 Tax=Rhododendron griersonianum TaxID=479676 RepID=A0AAV6KE47_9ERIC|nr:hypothetical protein RHGRI_015683 [Rhododendron griersonianum]